MLFVNMDKVVKRHNYFSSGNTVELETRFVAPFDECPGLILTQFRMGQI